MDIKGLKLFIINDDILKDSEQLRSFITEHKIKKLYLPSLLLKIHNQISINSKIKYILTGVEYLQAYRLKDGQLYIAKSTVPINIRWSRQLEGKHSSITIAKDCADRYFVSFCSEVEIKSLLKVDKTVGIDLGLTDFLVTSDGEKVKPLKALIKYQKKLARAQKRLSKKLQGSNNAKEARLKVARLHNKISDSRKDFLHKLSTKLINENQVISLEDLDIAGMLGNHKLSKAISDASWSEFTRLD